MGLRQLTVLTAPEFGLESFTMGWMSAAAHRSQLRSWPGLGSLPDACIFGCHQWGGMHWPMMQPPGPRVMHVCGPLHAAQLYGGMSAAADQWSCAGAEPERVKKEIEEVIGLDCSNAILASAKQASSP